MNTLYPPPPRHNEAKVRGQGRHNPVDEKPEVAFGALDPLREHSTIGANGVVSIPTRSLSLTMLDAKFVTVDW